MNRYHHTHTHTHTHGKDGIKFFTGELEGHARVTRLETAKNSVDARCMRSHTSACRRAPARPCRCPTTHVPLARRSHTHTQCPPMSMPHHPRASRRAPPPVSHTQCLPHGDPQPHVLLAARPRPSHIRSAYPPRSTTASRHTPPPEQNPRHSRPCAPARAAERRQHRAHRHEWHDTARQKREHRTRWYRKEARVARHRTAKTRASHAHKQGWHHKQDKKRQHRMRAHQPKVPCRNRWDGTALEGPRSPTESDHGPFYWQFTLATRLGT